MKQAEAIKAFISIKKLNSQDVSPRVAQNIFRLYKELQSVYDFQIQEEQKIFKKHPNFDVSIGGIKMNNSNDPVEKEQSSKEILEINNELKELGNTNTVVNFEKITINTMHEDIKLSGEDIANLEPFIMFVYGPPQI